ncbi:MAG: hypothetical protein AAGK17_11695 [Pseudomonadota bacterium]
MRAHSRQSGRLPIASHAIFKPALMGWGALILAAIILILPSSLIERLGMLTGLSILGDSARYVLAAIGAILGAGIGLGAATLVKSATAPKEDSDDQDEIEEEVAYQVDSDGVRPIDPNEDLGSASLDEPIEAAEYQEINESPTEQAEPPVEAAPEPTPELKQGRRRGLDQLVRKDEDTPDPDVIFPSEGSNTVQKVEAKEPQTVVNELANLGTQADEDNRGAESTEVVENEEIEYPKGAAEDDLKNEASGEETMNNSGNNSGKLGLPDAVGAQSALDALYASSTGSVSDADAELVASNEPAPGDEGGSMDDNRETPLVLDLEEFGALPGRNGVWVEDGAADETGLSALQAGEDVADTQIPTALARLRATPVEELSMVQMIERLAAALADRKATKIADPKHSDDPTGRKALAEGLKELSALADKARATPPPFVEADAPTKEAHIEDTGQPSIVDDIADLRGAA